MTKANERTASSLKNIIAEQKISSDSASFVTIHAERNEVSFHGKDGSFRTATATAAEVRDLIQAFNSELGGAYFLPVVSGPVEAYFNVRAVGAISYTTELAASGRNIVDLQLDGMHEQTVGLDPPVFDRVRAVLAEAEKDGKAYEGSYQASLREGPYAFNVNLERVKDISTDFGPLGPCLSFRFMETAENTHLGEFRLVFSDFEEFEHRVEMLAADTGFKLSSQNGSFKIFTPD